MLTVCWNNDIFFFFTDEYIDSIKTQGKYKYTSI